MNYATIIEKEILGSQNTSALIFARTDIVLCPRTRGRAKRNSILHARTNQFNQISAYLRGLYVFDYDNQRGKTTIDFSVRHRNEEYYEHFLLWRGNISYL